MDLERALAELTGDNRHHIKATVEEAALLDYVLVVHSFDESTFSFMTASGPRSWRHQAGEIIATKQPGALRLQDEEIEQLLALVPTTFRFGTEDVGLSLKTKLYQALLGLEDGPKKEAINANPNQAADTATDSPGTAS